jgi:uncharacterized alkaline shock family protein YloU
MPTKKDNLPLNVENDMESTGTITYANEVIAIIAGVATSEVEGIAGMCTSGGFSDILGRNRNITRGVKVELGTEETSVDLYVIVEYGTPIQKAAHDAQESVRKAIETMTGLHVVRVDVHVQGVSFEKENKALEKGLQSAALASGELFKAVPGEKEAAPEPPAPPVKVELVEEEEEEQEQRGQSEPEDGPDEVEAQLDAELVAEMTAEPEEEAGKEAEVPEPEAEKVEAAGEPEAEKPAEEPEAPAPQPEPAAQNPSKPPKGKKSAPAPKK